MSWEQAQQESINSDVYRITKEALLWERNRGIERFGSPIVWSVRLPIKLGGQLALRASLDGNYNRDFKVVGVTLELGRGSERSSASFTSDHPEVYDAFTGDLIDALANYDKHDHNMCMLKYCASSRWPDTLIDTTDYTSTLDASSVTFKEQPRFICHPLSKSVRSKRRFPNDQRHR